MIASINDRKLKENEISFYSNISYLIFFTMSQNLITCNIETYWNSSNHLFSLIPTQNLVLSPYPFEWSTKDSAKAYKANSWLSLHSIEVFKHTAAKLTRKILLWEVICYWVWIFSPTFNVHRSLYTPSSSHISSYFASFPTFLLYSLLSGIP